MSWNQTDYPSESDNTENDPETRTRGATPGENGSGSDRGEADTGADQDFAPADGAGTDANVDSVQADGANTDADVNADTAPADEAPPAPADSTALSAPSAPSTLSSADAAPDVQNERGATGKRKGGVLTYAIVMTACFVLSLAVLVAALVWDDGHASSGNGTSNSGGADRVVYVRELDNDSGVLTVQEIAARGTRSVVAISARSQVGGTYTTTGVGAGIIMTADGYIATNYHVISGADSILVQDCDGNSYDGEVIGYSEIDDLAVVKIQADGLSAATFGSSADVLVGDSVVVIGHPAGLEFGWSTTQGIISAINREVKIKDESGTLTKKMTLLQTSANVNSGNSGGPMFNERGEVIGVITLKLADKYEGMGFAIPSDGAMEILQAIIKDGNASGVDSSVSSGRPVLGITGVAVQADNYYVMGEDRISYPMTEEQAAATEGSFYVAYTGVLVTEVQEDRDAFGKLAEGDIIVALNGVEVSGMYTLRELLYDCNVGDTVTVKVMRDGTEKSVQVKLGGVK